MQMTVTTIAFLILLLRQQAELLKIQIEIADSTQKQHENKTFYSYQKIGIDGK